MTSLCAVALSVLCSTFVTPAADPDDPMATAATANARVSARRSKDTPFSGNGSATATVRLLITGAAPVCQHIRPESSANGAAREAKSRARATWDRGYERYLERVR